MGFKGPMFAPSASGDIYLVKAIVGENFAHDIFFLDDDLKDPNMPSSIKEVAARIKEKYGVEVTSAHCMGWEALYCLTQAIEAAQSLDPTVVAKTWEKMKKIDTLYGAGKMGGLKDFGINHVVMKPRPVTCLDKGKVKFLKFIEP
jgi:ABC-type branched-subunit amino acid transport system substrate-binding protein